MQTNLAIPIDVDYDHYLKNLTKKEKKRLKGRTSLSLKNIEPKTDNQIKTFTEYYNGKHGKKRYHNFLRLQQQTTYRYGRRNESC